MKLSELLEARSAWEDQTDEIPHTSHLQLAAGPYLYPKGQAVLCTFRPGAAAQVVKYIGPAKSDPQHLHFVLDPQRPGDPVRVYGSQLSPDKVEEARSAWEDQEEINNLSFKFMVHEEYFKRASIEFCKKHGIQFNLIGAIVTCRGSKEALEQLIDDCWPDHMAWKDYIKRIG